MINNEIEADAGNDKDNSMTGVPGEVGEEGKTLSWSLQPLETSPHCVAAAHHQLPRSPLMWYWSPQL